MIRVTLRQLRSQLVVAAVGLAALAVVVVLSRAHLVDLYDANVAGCAARGDCPSATDQFLRAASTMRTWFGIVIVVLPGLIGIFVGAPLVARELETGTFRLAWTQSVTRTRWLSTKLAVVGALAAVVAGATSLLVTWWGVLPDRVSEDLYAGFDVRDLAPVGHALFACMLGVAAGVVLRRTLPAMATTLVLLVAVRITVLRWVRPQLLGPLHRSSEIGDRPMGFGSTGSGPPTLMPEPPHMPNTWVLSTRLVDDSGHALTPSKVASLCPTLGEDRPRGPRSGDGPSRVPAGVEDALRRCMRAVGASYHEVVTYQPAHRYWALQRLELSLYVGAALVLAGACWWWVRRRLA